MLELNIDHYKNQQIQSIVHFNSIILILQSEDFIILITYSYLVTLITKSDHSHHLSKLIISKFYKVSPILSDLHQE